MKKTKKIAIIFALILLIGSVAFAGVYFFTDVFKTPQQAFYSYVSKATSFSNSGSSYQEMLEELKAAQEKSYKTETALGVEISSLNTSDKEAQQMANMLKNFKVNISQNVKPSEKKSTSNVSLNFGGFSAGNLKLVRDGETFGVQSELLGDKFLAVENKNLKQLVAKLGGNAQNVPNKIESIDLYDLLYISKEDEEHIEKTYTDIFKNNIPEENYSKQENVTKNINGQDVNTTAYKLTLGEKDFINVMTKVLETVEEDDTLLNIITEKFNKMIDEGMLDNLDVSARYSLSSTSKYKKTSIKQKISKDTLKQSLRKLINEFKAEGDYAGSAKAEIIVYAANNDIARMEIKTNDEVVLAADFYNKDNKKHIVLYGVEKSYSSKYYYTDYYRMPETKSELVKLMEIEYKTAKIGNDKTVYASFTMFEDDKEAGKFGIDLTSKGQVGQGKCETSGKIFFEIEGASIALIIDSKTEFTDDVNVESLNSYNSNVLNNMSEKEIERYFEGVAENIENTFSMFGLNSNTIIPKNRVVKNQEKVETNIENQQKQLEEIIKENQQSIEEEVNESKEELENKQKEEKERLEKQIEELNKALKQFEESNS